MLIFKDFDLMGEKVKTRLKVCEEGVTIHPFAKICVPENVELYSNCTIGDFTFIWGGLKTIIGRYSHVQVNVNIWGGGETIIGNYVSVALGSTLLSAVYDYKEGLRMVDHLPEGQTKTIFGKLTINDDTYIGANSIILPVTIGEGCIVGAGSLVNKDLEPWGVYVGSPCRKIGERRKDIIYKLREKNGD